MNILLTILSIICIMVLIGVVVYQVRIDGITRERLFEIQIKMSEAQASMTKEQPWKELKRIIDEIIDFTVSNYIITNGINKMSNEELTLNWTMMLNEICANVELSISDEIKRQVLKNITESYMTMYIKNSVQLVIVYRLENNKKNPVNEKLENIRNGVGIIKDNKNINNKKI